MSEASLIDEALGLLGEVTGEITGKARYAMGDEWFVRVEAWRRRVRDEWLDATGVSPSAPSDAAGEGPTRIGSQHGYTAHGYTAHGYACCTIGAGLPGPAFRARCMGPPACQKCAAHVAELHAAPITPGVNQRGPAATVQAEAEARLALGALGGCEDSASRAFAAGQLDALSRLGLLLPSVEVVSRIRVPDTHLDGGTGAL